LLSTLVTLEDPQLFTTIYDEMNSNYMTSKKGRSRPRRNARGRGALSSSTKNGSQLSQVVERWMPVTPAKCTKTLRYCDTIALTSSSGAVATYVYGANDAFDPDHTGTGHQPMGFDPLMLFYNHFCVVAASLRCTFKSTSGAVSTGLIRYDASATPLTVINRIQELGACVSVVLGTQGGFGSAMTIDLALDICKLQGVNRQTILADPSLRGDAATSPTERTYFHIQLFDAGGASSGAYVSVELVQTIIFTEPRDNVESFHRTTVNGKMVLTKKGEEKDEFVTVPKSQIAACLGM